MIIHDYHSLYVPLERAKELQKHSKDEAERIALSNYIGNLYDVMHNMGDKQVPVDFRKVFPVKRQYKSFIRGINIYSDRLIQNYILNKDFHRQYFGEILPEVEENVNELCKEEPVEDEALSKDDFFDILYFVFSSIGFDQEFDQFYQNGHIYASPSSQDVHNLGFTLYNPVNHDTDLFINNFQYTYRDMSTLIHEFGHGIDLRRFTGNIDEYNQYFYESFFGEVLSRLMERILHRYCIRNGILVDRARDSYINFEDLNHDYLLSSYIISLLDKDFILSGGHMLDKNKDIMAKKVAKYFMSAEVIRDFMEGIDTFDISENYTYAYGDILSLFLIDEVEQEGFSSDLFQYFMEKRHLLFQEEFMRECGFEPENYLKNYRKEVELIKK